MHADVPPATGTPCVCGVLHPKTNPCRSASAVLDGSLGRHEGNKGQCGEKLKILLDFHLPFPREEPRLPLAWPFFQEAPLPFSSPSRHLLDGHPLSQAPVGEGGRCRSPGTGPTSASPDARPGGHQNSPAGRSRTHTSWSLCLVPCEGGWVVAVSPGDGDGRLRWTPAQSKRGKLPGPRRAVPQVTLSTSSSQASESRWVLAADRAFVEKDQARYGSLGLGDPAELFCLKGGRC